MSAKKAGSGLGTRMASATAVQDVAAGFAAATGVSLPEGSDKAEDAAPAEVEAPVKAVGAPAAAAKADVVALNIRLPKAMHRELRDIAHRDETSITAILIQAATEWLAKPKPE